MRTLLPFITCLPFLLSSSHAVNSPRPTAVQLQAGQLHITWERLNDLHPWLLSHRDTTTGPWQWSGPLLWSSAGALTVTLPTTNTMGFYRLWPAPPP